MLTLLKRMLRDERGQGMTEYALIIALVAVAIIAIMIAFRNEIGNVFKAATTTLQNAPSPPAP